MSSLYQDHGSTDNISSERVNVCGRVHSTQERLVLEAIKCCLSLQQNIFAQAKTNNEAAT